MPPEPSTSPLAPPDPPTPPLTPAKDPIVERAYDYTKWHITLYGTVLSVLAGGLALGHVLPRYLLVPLLGLAAAGIAAGTIASTLSRRENWEGFLEKRTFPLVPDSKNFGFTMQTWMHIQHAGIWTAVLWGVAGAIVLSLSDKSPNLPAPLFPPSVTASPTP